MLFSSLSRLSNIVSRAALDTQTAFGITFHPSNLFSVHRTNTTSVGSNPNQSHSPLDGEELNEPDMLYKKLVITVKGHEPAVLNSYETFVREVCDNLVLNLHCETRHRPTFLRLSLNKSPFIYKKHQRQYEFRTYYKYFTVDRITGCTADVFLEYIQRNLPEGVAMEVARHRLEKLPEPLSPVADT
ncbi:Mitochondrial ribosomal protein S10 [Paragonimus heterotremus]|uniref:Small ribosomal subunit protein uS10m n=1 Tax=Paragonimus heterotremus TaxID=100268 RepID=A0A8J4T701_9TREM|nr:Mitochondrial ribosomal protein S10 [Paragonimus heterotremus]